NSGLLAVMIAADMDQDGYCDLVGRRKDEWPQQPFVTIVWGSPAGLVPGNTQMEVDIVEDTGCDDSITYSSVIDIAVADADTDGDLDVVVSAIRDWGGSEPANCERRGIGVIWCDGPRLYRETEEWLVREQFPTPVDAFYMLKVLTLGEDSEPEITMIDGITHKVMYSEGAGGWRVPEPTGLPGGWSVMADFDGDDVLDAVDGVYGKMWVNRGRSPSGFDLIESPDVAGLTPSAAGDLDGDGALDVVSYVYPTTTMMVHRNIAPLATGVPERVDDRRLRAVPSVVSRGVVRFERTGIDGEAGAGLRVAVRDVLGRVVWRGTSVESPNGVAMWSLTDLRGGPVPAGVYFAAEAGTSPGDAVRVLVIR
ncbi:MAG: VCBS repeat-containing protein, partial [Candidatus Eisenbacteria bacterium]|nr:VCBS repeat-containing protein [Candidatus Eisenbacteria bacterium]